MNYDVVEAELVTRLNAVKTANSLTFIANRLPEVQAGYDKPTTAARIYVAYKESKFDGIRTTDPVVQDETPYFEVIVQARKLRGNGAMYHTLGWIRRALLGFKPENCNRLYLVDASIVNNEDDMFTHSMVFACKTTIVQDVDAEDLPVITQITLDSEFGTSEITPPPPSPTFGIYANDATDPSYVQNIPAGETHVSPKITVFEVNGSERQQNANEDVTAGWFTVLLRNSDGVVITELVEYPTGGVFNLADIEVEDLAVFLQSFPVPSRIVVEGSEIDSVAVNDVTGEMTIVTSDEFLPLSVKSTDEVVTLATVNTYPSGGLVLVGNQRVRQQNNAAVANVPFRTDVKVINADILAVTQTTAFTEIEVVIPPPITPSGIVYSGLQPINNVSYRTGDAFDCFQAGHLTPADPTTPLRVARLDESSALFPTVLAANNKWGNTWRFTDLDGNPAGGAGAWGHVAWNSHTFPTGKENLVKDHYTGAIIPTVRFESAGKFSMNTGTAEGQSWGDWIDDVNALTTYLGISDLSWCMLPVDSRLPHFARVMMDGGSSGYDWTVNFFSVADTPVANRVQFVTAETNKFYSDAYMTYRDSGIPEVIGTGNTFATASTAGALKAGANSFIFNTCRIFLIAMDINDDY